MLAHYTDGAHALVWAKSVLSVIFYELVLVCGVRGRVRASYQNFYNTELPVRRHAPSFDSCRPRPTLISRWRAPALL